ncbi:putative acyl-CoA thioesterase [Tribonema minus]|uniref:Putative acyl-CoA thioesterase n=1 Tax=Tribonema minus TaxID=303371 RepID=A0A835Z9W3_9STRA|nr:putative acyl-CoA thioesterase [Tribonema minus]
MGVSWPSRITTPPEAYKSPLTEAFWDLRSVDKQLQEVEELAAKQRHAHPRPASASRKSITYDFSRNSMLRSAYANPWGFIRISRVLEDLDALAATIAMEHCATECSAHGVTFWPMLVTASVDRIEMKQQPMLERDLVLSGHIVWTGRSSMQILMHCAVAQDSTPAAEDAAATAAAAAPSPWLEARFTFVARSRDTGRSTPIPPLLIETPKEDEAFRHAQRAMDRKKLLRSGGGGATLAGANGTAPVSSPEAEAAAAALLREGRLLKAMPCLADPRSVLVGDTAQSSVIVCMPQERNTANRIFGGFLMGRALELGFATAYTTVGAVPFTAVVDEVVFHQPVDVGDILKLDSCVLQTRAGGALGRSPRASVEVLAHVLRPDKRTMHLSNRFDFTFKFPELARRDDGEPQRELQRVLPSDVDEAQRVVQVMQRQALHREEQADSGDSSSSTSASSNGGVDGSGGSGSGGR